MLLVTSDTVQKQSLTRYKLVREKYREHLVGIEDERVGRVHTILARLLDVGGLTRSGPRWEVMVVNDWGGNNRIY